MRATLALVLIAVCGCGDPVPELWERAEEVRELPLLEDVEVLRMTREQYAAQAAERAASLTDERLQYYAETYGRMGYFPMDLDLRPILAGSSSDWVGASYSPGAGRITLVGDAPDHTVVHEYVHALQDQHFGIGDYDLRTSDGFLARRAIVEGDATLAHYRFRAQEELGTDLHGIDWTGVFDGYRGFSDGLLEDGTYPPVFVDYPTFCYAYGLQFVAHNLMGVSFEAPYPSESYPFDWGRQDELFTERPTDTTQGILLLAENADPIEVIGLDRVPEALVDVLVFDDWDSMGEWNFFLLLYPVLGDVDARALAGRWDGDRVLFVIDVDTGERGLVWASAWDDEASAAALVDAMWAIVGRAFVYGGPPELGYATDGEAVWLERRAHRVVFAKNVREEIVAQLAAAAFDPDVARAARPRVRPSLVELIDELR